MANVQNLNRIYKAPPMHAPSMTDSDLNLVTEQKSNEENVVKIDVKSNKSKRRKSYVSKKDYSIDGKKDNFDLLKPEANTYYDQFFTICNELDLNQNLQKKFLEDKTFIKYVT